MRARLSNRGYRASVGVKISITLKGFTFRQSALFHFRRCRRIFNEIRRQRHQEVAARILN